MKKLSFKELARQKMERQVDDYLKKGGKINHVPNGKSGWDAAQGPLKPTHLVFEKSQHDYSPLHQVVAKLDERRRQKKQKNKPQSRLNRPKQKVLYDDFGEPIRKIWLDE